ncbi:serine/threonine-protein kinase [Parvibaculum sp.]|uniref:serine/threonine-protein kinase n=1 Tax=Parvibaculum sp. TaxID=2024848 RepID=UPI001DA774B3|nr:serine/threonine-protein kinase [Parvibaculum sp.]MBX3489356.1 serine/threonine protein kinase [Parvibaculum sp.]MCW5726688.1 serine/threonine protein kinase [Parvibaculum sp.]
MQTIKLLGGEWTFDESKPLGPPGGFGQVFLGSGPDGPVAVKRLLIRAAKAAHRELSIGRKLMSRELHYVVPVLDAGQDAESDRYFLIMPVCDCSLQEKIDELDGTFDVDLFQTSIRAILGGLEEVSDITHRDLKPSNVLLHDGTWKIADFGIAKFVEDSTSIETLKEALTPAYAAPEQWEGRKVSSATDIYALGCIATALATGNPPFLGSVTDVRDMHLHTAPPEIAVLPARIAAFVTQMLRKQAAARPTLSRCKQVFGDIPLQTKNVSGAVTALQTAGRQLAKEEAELEAIRQSQETRYRERGELFNGAKGALLAIRNRFFKTIQDEVDNAGIVQHRLSAGAANVEFGGLVTSVSEDKGKAPGKHKWDIVAISTVRVSCSKSGPHYVWSASLVYADPDGAGSYRWYEISFWQLMSENRDEPFAIPDCNKDLHDALSNAISAVSVAYGPMPIDGEDEEKFFERWQTLVAKAIVGELRRPSSMPIRSWPK